MARGAELMGEPTAGTPLMGVSTYTFCCLTVRGLVRVICGSGEGSAGGTADRPPPPVERLENKSPPPSSLEMACGSVELGRGGGVGGGSLTALPGRTGRGGLGKGGRLTLARV